MRKRSGEVYNFKWEEPDPTGEALPGGRAKCQETCKEVL